MTYEEMQAVVRDYENAWDTLIEHEYNRLGGEAALVEPSSALAELYPVTIKTYGATTDVVINDKIVYSIGTKRLVSTSVVQLRDLGIRLYRYGLVEAATGHDEAEVLKYRRALAERDGFEL